MKQVLCCYCHRNKAVRPRGLCRRHYFDKAIRGRYAAKWSKYHRKEPPDFDGPAPGKPTRAGPGTPEKVLVMCQRAGVGEELFHPRDGQRRF